MPPVVKQALRSRWFAACAHVGLWLLLILALIALFQFGYVDKKVHYR